MFRIVFVCTGNMCRSPLAEGILDQKIRLLWPDELSSFVEVSSCGIYALPGKSPSAHSVEIARESGVDISGGLPLHSPSGHRLSPTTTLTKHRRL